jgi:2-dehydro-3-deoxygalactonokinase
MIAILDCGTTNTKCYITEVDGSLRAESYTPIGCRNTSLFEQAVQYGEFLSQTVSSTCNSARLNQQEITTVIAFGMISSDLGLTVVPHLDAPAGLEELSEGIFCYREYQFFGSSVDFYIIRGIKNPLQQSRATHNIRICDFMRGEETQIMGILQRYKPKTAINIITLGTHFKAIHVDASGKICKSMTTMSGQLFDCITNNTIVGKSVATDELSELSLSRRALAELAKEMLEKYGFNRTVLLPRFMESFTDLTPKDRLVFLDMAIAFDDLSSIRDFFAEPSLAAKQFFIVGQKQRCKNLALAIEIIDPSIKIIIIDGVEKNRDISILGSMAICAMNQTTARRELQ